MYVFDDKLVLSCSYQHGTQMISLEEIEEALSSDFDGLLRQTKSESYMDSDLVYLRTILHFTAASQRPSHARL